MIDGTGNHRPFFLGSAERGVDRRAMVSLGPVSEQRYCFYDCKFCYVQGPFPKYDIASPDEILQWLLKNAGAFDVIYISGDTDSFAFKRAPQAIRLLRLISEHMSELQCEVLFTTRYVFSDNENAALGEIAKTIRAAGRLLIGCVSVCQLRNPELEPRPLSSPYDRIDQLGAWKHLGLSTVLAIRPFIPGVPVRELIQIASHGVRYADVVIGGHLYVDKNGNIERKLSESISNWSSADHISIDRELDFTHTTDMWTEVQYIEAEREVRAICKQLGKPFFMRSTPAVEHIKENRAYYVGSNNQRMFAANVMASVAMQTSIAEQNASQPELFRNEDEMPLLQFIASYETTTDEPPSIFDAESLDSEPGFAMIVAEDPRFQTTFRLLQEELQTLFLNTFREDEIQADSAVRIILYGSVDDVGKLFGSVPHGWDVLVKMKRELLGRNRLRSVRTKWFASLFADVEKNLRNLVCTAVTNMGANPIFSKAILKTLEAHRASKHDAKNPSVLSEISTDLAKFMARDAEKTFEVAANFFKELSPKMHSEPLTSTVRMVKYLSDLGQDKDQILSRLLELRRTALHDPEFQDFFPHKSFVASSSFDEVTRWTDERCSVVAQFLCSICVESALCCMDALLSDDNKLSLEVSALYKNKANAEFRVHSLSLLQSNADWLAYFVSEAVDRYLEDGKSLMLKLNAAYAFQNIANRSGGRIHFSEAEVPAPKDGQKWHPKHRLIRKSILKDVTGLRELMFDAAKEMSLQEFRRWPALSFVQRTPEFQNTIAELEDELRSRAMNRREQ